MKLAGRPFRRSMLACSITVCALSGCHYDSDPYERQVYVDPETVPECDPTLEIAPAGRALMVTEPEALAGLPLEDVLSKLLADFADHETTPLELAQRLFDTSNQEGAGVYPDGIHCDSPSNLAHANGPAAFCPRVEGALAASNGLFTPGHPDHLYPVAAVNRIDLMPFSGLSCGEYRIVYAKESGLEDPDDRVFLIFEMSLPNPEPGDLFACRPVAEFWRSLDAEEDSEVVGQKLRSFFFEGLPGLGPVISTLNLGFGSFGGSSYYSAGLGGGQVRVSQHMDQHWEMRQMVMSSAPDGGRLRFDPTTVGNNPLPSRFEAVLNDSSDADFALGFAAQNVGPLSAKEVTSVTMSVSPADLSGESALGGEAVNDYAARGAGNQYLLDFVANKIAELGAGADCPADDPLTPDSILRRATMDSCAGCHAPDQFLGPERKIGCGLTWPASLGEVHIDEKGQRSPALDGVFLPHRAEVMTTYLRACDAAAIDAAFGGPSPGGTTTKSLNARRTIGGGATH